MIARDPLYVSGMKTRKSHQSLQTAPANVQVCLVADGMFGPFDAVMIAVEANLLARRKIIATE